MKESRHANFGAIEAIFLQLSWSQHKLAHSCQRRGQRSNGAINRNKHFFRSFCRGISNLVTPSLKKERERERRERREREREKERKREREREKEKERERQRERETETERQRDREVRNSIENKTYPPPRGYLQYNYYNI